MNEDWQVTFRVFREKLSEHEAERAFVIHESLNLNLSAHLDQLLEDVDHYLRQMETSSSAFLTIWREQQSESRPDLLHFVQGLKSDPFLQFDCLDEEMCRSVSIICEERKLNPFISTTIAAFILAAIIFFHFVKRSKRSKDYEMLLGLSQFQWAREILRGVDAKERFRWQLTRKELDNLNSEAVSVLGLQDKYGFEILELRKGMKYQGSIVWEIKRPGLKRDHSVVLEPVFDSCSQYYWFLQGRGDHISQEVTKQLPLDADAPELGRILPNFFNELLTDKFDQFQSLVIDICEGFPDKFSAICGQDSVGQSFSNKRMINALENEDPYASIVEDVTFTGLLFKPSSVWLKAIVKARVPRRN